MSDQKETPDVGKSSLGQKVKFYADIILKLTPALATVTMGLIAYDFQARSSAATLLNQREQAETQLRAALFENLIGPLGVSVDGELDPDHQRLLVELLMLNFHEHIEFKPLLIHTDLRLAAAIDSEENIKKARDSLRSVARRVRERQVAVLMKEQEFGYELNKICSYHTLNCDFYEMGITTSDVNDMSIEVPNPWVIYSPNNRYELEIRVKKSEMDWKNQQFGINVIIKDNNEESSSQLRSSSFSITPYDLPFTDNMIIDSKQRLAIGVSDIEPKDEKMGVAVDYVTLQAVWFPEGYILPHERPVNYQEIRELLNLEDDEKEPQEIPVSGPELPTE